MTRDSDGGRLREATELLGQVTHDVERLLGQHGQLLRSELRDGLGQLPPALASVSAGAGLVAAGGILGSLMLVHGLHRATRLPLWGCYGLVGGVMSTLGVGLLASGTRRVAHLRLIPSETLAALQEDAQWIKDQVVRPPKS